MKTIIDTKYPYQIADNDPSKTRIYTLENGLKVFLSQNLDEPKIQTYIAVKTGSNNDPSDTTGVAHYFEHMMFKGNEKIGTLDWEKEKVLLDELEELFEVHRQETNIEKKAEIYKKIDAISFEASKLTVPNEYDKFTSLMGASNVNAHTSYNETIYYNTIPKNELKKWMILESCRFSSIALRLFHTELETVYEEYNRSQDNDGRAIFYTMMENLFPNSKYGTQTVLGSPNDLKNPSMKAINEYFKKYYVASNMAIIMIGDLDFDETIALIDNSFGRFEKVSPPEQYIAQEKTLTENINTEIYSPSAERIQMAYRFEGYNSTDAKYIKLIDLMLNNSVAGLMDLHINQNKKAQSVASATSFYREYGLHIFAGTPKAGQTLEEVQTLILNEIDNIKSGKFDEWLIEAVVNDYKKANINNIIKPASLGTSIYRAFINDFDWQDAVNQIDEMGKITKTELMQFAQEKYQHFVSVYKRQGENKTLNYVKSPNITPIEINRKDESMFFKNFKTIKSDEIEPKFVDFEKEINAEKIKDINFYHVKNQNNSLISVYFLTEMGKDHDRFLSIALGYLDYAGTSKYSAEEIRKLFYRYGVDFGIQVNNERTFLYLTALEENIENGIKLMNHLLTNFVIEEKSLQDYKEKLVKNRQNAVVDKAKIAQALSLYAKYGPENRQRTLIKNTELLKKTSEEFHQNIRQFLNLKSEVFTYAQNKELVKNVISKHHQFGLSENIPTKHIYPQPEAEGNIYFTPYEMVQTEIRFVARDQQFDLNNFAYALLFNEYIGSGLSSVVFQEIREAKSLAYSASANYNIGNKKDDYSYLSAMVGTQPDKMLLTIETMNQILDHFPRAKVPFEAAKTSIIKKLSSKRFANVDVFFYWLSVKDKGLNEDFNQKIIADIQHIDMDKMEDFYNRHIANKKQSLAVIGKEEDVMPYLIQLNKPIIELSNAELFNF